jgi:hypothetical protein
MSCTSQEWSDAIKSKLVKARFSDRFNPLLATQFFQIISSMARLVFLWAEFQEFADFDSQVGDSHPCRGRLVQIREAKTPEMIQFCQELFMSLPTGNYPEAKLISELPTSLQF